MQIKAAETHVQLAEISKSGNPPSFLAASAHYQSAIEAFRKIGGMTDRVKKIHQDLILCQERSMGEMKTFEIKVDPAPITGMINQAANHVKGKSFSDAILAFVLMYPGQKVEDLRARVEEQSRETPFQHLIQANYVNESGRVVAQRPSPLSTEAEEREAGLRCEMFAMAAMGQDVVGQGLIEPARFQIYLEHPVRAEDFLRIIKDSPFVPAGRGEIYARGLYAGFSGDWMGAVHLLVPQFENSIRYLLYKQGVISSGYDNVGIQNDYDLNRTLFMDEVEKVFGDDIIFDLRGLLVEKCGTNLRNIVCHGLMNQFELQHSNKIRYFWWLTLRLILLPLIAVPERKGSTDQ